MNETYGRDVAEAEEIETRGTAFILLLLVRDGVIDVEEGREAVDAMFEAGWCCALGMYATVLRKLDLLCTPS